MGIDDIVDFIIKYSPYKDRDKIREYINLHLLYHTCIVIYEGDEIIAVARWNISPSGKIAFVLDTIIKEGYRNNGMMKRLIEEGTSVWKSVKYLAWEREWKYPDREQKIYSLKQILKRR